MIVHGYGAMTTRNAATDLAVYRRDVRRHVNAVLRLLREAERSSSWTNAVPLFEQIEHGAARTTNIVRAAAAIEDDEGDHGNVPPAPGWGRDVDVAPTPSLTGGKGRRRLARTLGRSS